MDSYEEKLQSWAIILDQSESLAMDSDAIVMNCADGSQGTIKLLRSAAQHIIDSQNLLRAGTAAQRTVPFSWFKPVE
jgi:hypothetical protein